MIRVGIVGVGVVGQRRAATASADPASTLVAVADADPKKALECATWFGCRVARDVSDLTSSDDIDAVVVATPHDALATVALEALTSGKHVLCEKPLARCASEAEPVIAVAERHCLVLKVGFTHRFQPAIRDAKAAYDAGLVGNLVFARAAYGHGGRPSYSSEWRANCERAGGGDLIDQGIHVLDLLEWFAADWQPAAVQLARAYWHVESVEDNAFLLLTTPAGQVASVHCSSTQWDNLFRLELYGKSGYLVVTGLGGAYGLQRLTVGIRVAEGVAPTQHVHNYSSENSAWTADWHDFVEAVQGLKAPEVDGRMGHHTLYQSGLIRPHEFEEGDGESG